MSPRASGCSDQPDAKSSHKWKHIDQTSVPRIDAQRSCCSRQETANDSCQSQVHGGGQSTRALIPISRSMPEKRRLKGHDFAEELQSAERNETLAPTLRLR